MKKIFKAVRSYGPDNSTGNRLLNEEFDEGWQFVRASEYVLPEASKAGYIEYILCKEVEE